MRHTRIGKVIRAGNSLAVVIPARLCRELNMQHGTLVSIQVADADTLLLARVKVVDAEATGLQRDTTLPIIKYGK